MCSCPLYLKGQQTEAGRRLYSKIFCGSAVRHVFYTSFLNIILCFGKEEEKVPMLRTGAAWVAADSSPVAASSA